MERSEARQATRKNIIEAMKVRRIKRGEVFYPPELLTKANSPNEIWRIFLTMREGLQPTRVSILDFVNEEAVAAFQHKHPLGSEMSDLTGDENLDRKILMEYMKLGPSFGICAGDEESPLAYDVLSFAEIYAGRLFEISREVAEYLGKERIVDLKVTYGESWQVAAAFEYCWLKLPHSSPAFAAASYQFHHYISQDEFSAGYHWRDLEIMVHKVEVQALKIIETRARAGATGSRISAQARGKRRAALFSMIESLAARNPDMMKFLSAHVAAKMAADECAKENPGLWRQGKGQVIEYLDEIRRGEAGSDLQMRYVEVFGTTPPKRFKGLG